MEDEIEEMDIVDEALEELIEELIPDSVSEEEFDRQADLFMSIYADLVDDGIIPEAPFLDDADEVKQSWIDSSIPVIRERFVGDSDANLNLE